MRHKLTATRARSAGPGWHGDGDGLWLRVQPTGSRSWIFIAIRNHVRQELGLGSFRNVSLALARAKAEELRMVLGRGGDPMAERRRVKVKVRTFAAVADELFAKLAPTFKNDKHRSQWRSTIQTYATSLLPMVSAITTDDVVACLDPIWLAKHATASRVRGRIESVLDYAKALHLRDGENPARWKGHLKLVLGTPQQETTHLAAMHYDALPGFLTRLRAEPGLSARALEFSILTDCRSAEVLGATWAEVDFAKALWTIPASRMKAGAEHVVPLAPDALAILQQLYDRRMSRFVFAGLRPEKPLNKNSMLTCLRRLDAGATAHGFRSSFRDWSGDETSFPREVIEQALAHTVGSATEQSYRRSSALAKRRQLMTAWGSFCAGGSTVVELRIDRS